MNILNFIRLGGGVNSFCVENVVHNVKPSPVYKSIVCVHDNYSGIIVSSNALN